MTWDFLHRWQMPFLWLTMSSLIAVPFAMYLQNGMVTHTGAEMGMPYGNDWVLRDHFLESIVVYLLNLGCAVWLLDGDGSTRWAAFWALVVGIGRVVAPVLLVTLSGPTVAGSHYVDWQTLRVVIWFADVEMFLLGIMLWGIFARFVGETNGQGAASAHAAHAY